jgi:hypothetical protein
VYFVIVIAPLLVVKVNCASLTIGRKINNAAIKPGVIILKTARYEQIGPVVFRFINCVQNHVPFKEPGQAKHSAKGTLIRPECPYADIVGQKSG